MRIAAGVEYDGSAFSGWQAQPGARSVQRAVEDALAEVANHPLQVVCAGRTDAGVHAVGQVVHFEAKVSRPPRAWVFGANTVLPEDVNLLWAREIDEDFHARYSALERTYRYWILNRRTRSGLGRNRCCWEPRALDARLMHSAGRYLIGAHDFSAFRAAACQARSPVRNLTRLEVRRHAELISIEITANAFLHHMVRNIAGVLMAVGRNEQSPEWVQQVLEGRDRCRAGVTAPAGGLYLLGVRYPEVFDLPRDARAALARPLEPGDPPFSEH